LTLFEYLSVAVSIVLSLSAAQILSSIRAVLQPDKRYWVHVVWVVIALYSHIVLWWEFWAFRDVAAWSLGRFALVLVNPGLLFVASNALVHADSDKHRTWEDHFYSVRRSLFVTFAMLMVVSILRDWVLLDARVEFPRLLPEAAMTLIYGVGLASKSKRIHAGLAILCIFVALASTAFLWLQPGGGSGL